MLFVLKNFKAIANDDARGATLMLSRLKYIYFYIYIYIYSMNVFKMINDKDDKSNSQWINPQT